MTTVTVLLRGPTPRVSPYFLSHAQRNGGLVSTSGPSSGTYGSERVESESAARHICDRSDVGLGGPQTKSETLGKPRREGGPPVPLSYGPSLRPTRRSVSTYTAREWGPFNWFSHWRRSTRDVPWGPATSPSPRPDPASNPPVSTSSFVFRTHQSLLPVGGGGWVSPGAGVRGAV